MPLASGVARKWDAVSELLAIRVIGRADGDGSGEQRFRLVRTGRLRFAGAFHLLLPAVLASELRRFRPEVIVAQSPFEAAIVLLVVRLMRARPRVLVEVHGDWRTATRAYGSRARRLLAPVADAVATAALRRADGVRAISRFTAKLAAEATNTEPLAVFPTFGDIASFDVDPVRPLPEQPRLAWIGALQPTKNPEAFADVWRRVAQRFPEAGARIVGDGPLRPIMEELVRDFPDRVEWFRRLPPVEVARVLDSCTMLVLPSRSEGLGRVAIEALTRGRPVVGFAVGGIPDVVVHDRNGLLVAPGRVDLLASDVVRLLAQPELAARLAQAAKQDSVDLRWSADRYAVAVRDTVHQVLER